MYCNSRSTFRTTILLVQLPMLAVGVMIIAAVNAALAQTPLANSDLSQTLTAAEQSATSPDQTALEESFVEMLSGATLEGSFTSTGAGRDSTRLSREKYIIGEVRKTGDFWTISARIQYGDHDVTLPITVPVRWAGDTPVIVVDNLALPGFGTVSARVMFFADHYAGYWKHGDHGGHLFGLISREDNPAETTDASSGESTPSVRDPSGREQGDE